MRFRVLAYLSASLPVRDPDGWHVPTFDDPVSAAAYLGTCLDMTVPPLPEM